MPLAQSLRRLASLLALAALAACPQGSFTWPDTATATSGASETGEPTTGPDLCGNATCDPGEPQSCPQDCVGCGNGVVEGGEACDDGDADNTDECTDACLPAACGDGFVRAGVEVCDDAGDNSPDAWTPMQRCAADCQGYTDHCGDDVCQTDHEGFASCAADGCAPVCGDGVVEGDEPCDDGNDLDTDDCLDDCVLARCGDGVVHAGVEDCDDADADNSDSCLDTCVTATCGDGKVHLGEEECDDGNDVDDDKCSNGCKRPRRVFVTSVFYTGSLGGLAGADARCQTLSEAAGLESSFHAWLSDNTGSPSTRFDTDFDGDYRLVNGTLIARGWADLTDGELEHAIDRSEKNALTQGAVWTNTRPDGTVDLIGKHCNGWKSSINDLNNEPGTGFAGALDGGWTQSDQQACGSSFSIYCFEDP